MYEQLEKSKENKGRAIANSVRQKKSCVEQGVGFVDNRPETTAYRNNVRHQSGETIQLATTRLGWDDTGNFIGKGSTSPEKICQILNTLKSETILSFVNVRSQYKNGHIVAAGFGGAQNRTNLVSWGDQMEDKQGDFEKTIMNGGKNSAESAWKSYPSGGVNEEGNLTDTVTVDNGSLDSSIKNAWVDNVADIIKAKDDVKFNKLGSQTIDDRPTDQKIKDGVVTKYDSKVSQSFNLAVSRLPTTHELSYEPDSSMNPNSRTKIENKLASFPSVSYNKNQESYNYLKPIFISDGNQRWKVLD